MKKLQFNTENHVFSKKNKKNRKKNLVESIKVCTFAHANRELNVFLEQMLQ